MGLSYPINIRIDELELEKLKHDAVLQGQSVPALIRERLAFHSKLHDELVDIRREVVSSFIDIQQRLDALENGGQGEAIIGGGLPINGQAEMLLLIRHIAGAGGIRAAHSELKRQGMTVYRLDQET